MKMGLVGLEGRYALKHAHGHNPEGIHHRMRHHSKRKCHYAVVYGCVAGSIAVNGIHYHHSEEHSQEMRTRITDKHFLLLAEHIEIEEGDECTYHRDCHTSVDYIALHHCKKRAYHTCQNAEARREAVDTVYQVHRIHQSYA